MKTGLIRRVINKTRKSGDIKSLEEYIDKLIYSGLSRSQKLKIGKQFVKQTGISGKEIIKARNRHPYCKSQKNKNIYARLKKRNLQFKDKPKRRWTEEELELFILINPDMTDIELSNKFERSIPAINSIRRKLSIIQKYGKKEFGFIWLLMREEKNLKIILNGEKKK